MAASRHITSLNNNNNNNNNNDDDEHHSIDDISLNLDHGDPVMFYPYWKNVDDECSVAIKASDLLSYFANTSNKNEFVYQMPGFTEAVRKVHRVVGNAVTDGRYIIGGAGSSQLFIYALRALASTVDRGIKKKRIPVACDEPYYSRYGEAIKAEKSEMYEWKGDANTLKEGEGPYIEIVTCPNNPDGMCRSPVVNRQGGLLIHDMAYCWPQYTPITAPADYDIMLFSMSKATGHAGSRIGWAIVKDPEIAAMMMKQVSLMSIGSCQEGQLRATKILQFTAHTCGNFELKTSEKLFEYGCSVLEDRWNRLRGVVKYTGVFNLPDFPPQYCNFLGKLRPATPGFAWMESKRGDDAAQIMTELKIQARSGSSFGSSIPKKYVRVSLLGNDDTFNLFLERLSRLL